MSYRVAWDSGAIEMNGKVFAREALSHGTGREPQELRWSSLSLLKVEGTVQK